MERPYGMHPHAFTAYIQACFDAGIDPERVIQTIGNASASAGTHEQDGEADGIDYCAATDIRARDLLDSELLKFIDRLANNGFAAYYREPGYDHWPSGSAEHIHAVFAGCPMKQSLRHQIHDWCHVPCLNGLASHAPYRYFQPTVIQVNTCRELFLANNPAQG